MLALLRGRARVIVVNRSWELAPWADVLYAADDAFWCTYDGVKDFHGMRVAPRGRAANKYGLTPVELMPNNDPSVNGLSATRGVLARGGHSGHQAINLAVQFGARYLMLLGLDFCVGNWHGPHVAGLRNTRQDTLDKWCARVDALRPHLDAIGVVTINCSPSSRLTAYPKSTVQEALDQWR